MTLTECHKRQDEINQLNFPTPAFEDKNLTAFPDMTRYDVGEKNEDKVFVFVFAFVFLQFHSNQLFLDECKVPESTNVSKQARESNDKMTW